MVIGFAYGDGFPTATASVRDILSNTQVLRLL
jgi:hypothetical protein